MDHFQIILRALRSVECPIICNNVRIFFHPLWRTRLTIESVLFVHYRVSPHKSAPLATGAAIPLAREALG